MGRRTRFDRVLAVVVSLAMVVSLNAPMVAWGDNAGPVDPGPQVNEPNADPVAQVEGGESYFTVQDALDAAGKSKVVLLANVAEDLTFALDTVKKLDLNGCTLTGSISGGTISFYDSQEEGVVTGSVNIRTLRAEGGTFKGVVTATTGMTVNGGTFDGELVGAGDIYLCTINGGSFNAAVSLGPAKNVKVTGGVFKEMPTIDNSSKLVISGGTFPEDPSQYLPAATKDLYSIETIDGAYVVKKDKIPSAVTWGDGFESVTYQIELEDGTWTRVADLQPGDRMVLPENPRMVDGRLNIDFRMKMVDGYLPTGCTLSSENSEAKDVPYYDSQAGDYYLPLLIASDESRGITLSAQQAEPALRLETPYGNLGEGQVDEWRTRFFLTFSDAADYLGTGDPVGDKLTLLKDMNESLTVPKGSTVTLDLNGKTLNGGTASGVAALTNNGTVTVKDSAGGGLIKREDNGANGYYVIDNQGTMTIEGGSVYNSTGTIPNGASLIRNGGVKSDRKNTLTIAGGDIKQDGFIAVKNDDYGTLAVTGGTITATGGDAENVVSAIQNWSQATISGGTINGAVWTSVYSAGLDASKTVIDGSDVTVNGEFVVWRAVGYDTGDKAPSMEIKSGTFDVSSWTVESPDYVSISGGTFSSDPSTYLAKGYAATENGSGWYEVARPTVARIGDAEYPSVAEAVAAASDGATVMMVADATIDEPIILEKSLTLDLNGRTITDNVADDRAFHLAASNIEFTVNGTVANSSMVVPAENVTALGFVYVDKDATDCTVTFNGGKYQGDTKGGRLLVSTPENNPVTLNVNLVDVTALTNNLFIWSDVMDGGGSFNLSVQNGTYETTNGSAFGFSGVTESSKVSFNGATVKTKNGYGVQAWGTVNTFENCEFSTTGTSNPGAPSTTVAVAGGGTANIVSGTYTSNHYGAYVFSSGGTLNVKGGTVSGEKDGIKVDCDGHYGVVNARAVISGGAVIGNLVTDVNIGNWKDGCSCDISVTGGEVDGSFVIGEKSNFTVSGGTFSEDPTTYLVKGFSASKNADNKYVVSPPVASVTASDGTIANYASLAEAVSKVEAGQTITLLKDAAESQNLTIGKTGVVLEMNGHDLTLTSAKGKIIIAANTGGLTIRNSEDTGGSITAEANPCLLVNIESFAELQGVSLSTTSSSAVTSKGTFTMRESSLAGSLYSFSGSYGEARIVSGILNGKVSAGASCALTLGEKSVANNSLVLNDVLTSKGALTIHCGDIKSLTENVADATTLGTAIFRTDISSKLPAGYACVAGADDSGAFYRVVELTAENSAASVTSGEKVSYFADVQAAVDALTTGDTLTLLRDHTSDKPLEVKCYGIAFDLNGFALVNTSEAAGSHALSFVPGYSASYPGEAQAAVTVKNSSASSGCITADVPLFAKPGSDSNALSLIVQDGVKLISSSDGPRVQLESNARVPYSESMKAEISNGGFLSVDDEGAEWIFGSYPHAMAIDADASVTLLNDYVGTGSIAPGFSAGTLDLGGHAYCTSAPKVLDMNRSGASITVKNGTMVSANKQSEAVGIVEMVSYDNLTVTLENVNLKAEAEGARGIDANGTNTGHAVTLKNCVLDVPQGLGIYFPSSGSLVLEDTVVNAKSLGVQLAGGSLSILGDKTTISVTGGPVEMTKADGPIEDGVAISIVKRDGYSDIGKVSIAAGTFSSNAANTALKAYAFDGASKEESAWTEAKDHIVVTGGTFSSMIDAGYYDTALYQQNPLDAQVDPGRVVPRTYKIEYDLDGGSADNPTSYTFASEEITLANPTRAGYVFAGWTGTGLSEASMSVVIAKGSTGDRSYVATWMPATDTKYTVRHLFQNVSDDKYTLDTSKTQVLLGTTEAKTAAEAMTVSGFAAKAFEQQTVAADGSAVVDIYYDRNIHNVLYKIDGAYFATDSYKLIEDVRYGADLSTIEDDMTKAGYVWSGWSALPAAMPNADVTVTGSYTAAADTKYTVSYLFESLDDGYEADEAHPDKTMTGTTNALTNVSAETVEGFTPQAMEQKSIAADGSTVVTVKYDRNSYKVHYAYGGTVPAGASLPEAGTFRFGEPVQLASAPALDGYAFAGWSRANGFAMPAEDVTVTGSWNVIPLPDADVEIQVEVPVAPGDGSAHATVPDNTVKAAAQNAQRALESVQAGKVPAGMSEAQVDQVVETLAKAEAEDRVIVVVSLKADAKEEHEVDEADRSAIGGVSSDGEKATLYLDLSVMMTVRVAGEDGVKSEAEVRLSEVDEPLLFEIRVNPELIKGKSVRIAHAHGDGVEIIEPEAIDREKGIVHVRAWKFSTYALLTSETCLVTFDAKGGSSVEPQSVPFGSAANRPADPTREGYEFAGWYADEDYATLYDFSNPVESPLALYAKWAAKAVDPGTDEPGGDKPGTDKPTPEIPGGDKPAFGDNGGAGGGTSGTASSGKTTAPKHGSSSTGTLLSTGDGATDALVLTMGLVGLAGALIAATVLRRRRTR